MDVMKPYLYYVDGRCYRRMAIKYPKYNDEIRNDDISKCQLNAENKICEDIEGVVITEETAESVSATLNIANSYFGYIVGRKKETKHRLEKETNTKITVPNQEERLPVTVKGETKYSVMSCARRIMMIVNAARLHQSFTHFLSIPFTASEIVTNFENFKDSVLKECLECNNICKDLFQNPNRLHLTVGTLVLMNENERKIARELLHQCKESVVLPILKKDLSNVSCRLHGIEIMNDDPANVNVLYGKVEFDSVEELDRFQQFVDKVCEHFETSGLLINKFEHVKLHVTLLNNVFQHGSDSEEMSDKIGDGETNKQRRVPFDARKILKLFADFDFGIQPSLSLHLSQRYAFESNGYYQCTDRI
ncbi:Activating signal cointegrator 1 complex subunit 1 [Trichinella britovi]|uniref:Activating signal cointegrator 1 complex subunit 1 n=1 Tax=Trichinella britovi TaxID=45882 RepID=A0A0V1D8B5_TRIBR|nr:Activating signal cointegrator 1 complex subunit 1 [Trichinella britovi]